MYFYCYRIFGHFEKPIFLKLCRHTEILNVHAGSYLFKVGDPDENVFIVQNGLVSVDITSIDGSIVPLKLVKTGDSVTSLLSFTDVLIVSFNINQCSNEFILFLFKQFFSVGP